MKDTTHRTTRPARVGAALAAGVLSALVLAGPATAAIDDGAPAGVDVGLAKHGNMPPLTDSETVIPGTSSDDGLPYLEIGLGALSGAAFTVAAFAAVSARRHAAAPRPA